MPRRVDGFYVLKGCPADPPKVLRTQQHESKILLKSTKDPSTQNDRPTKNPR